MKIGDKVRFLSEVGGGVVTGFKDKNTVLVEDADGFDIPMPVRECVVVDTNDYNIARVNTGEYDSKALHQKGVAAKKQSEDPADRPVTFVPKPQERRGADVLNVYLAFLPVNPKEMTTTAFEAYIVNDSNYFLNFMYMSVQDGGWKVRFQGTVEPNTKLFMEEFTRGDLNEMERVNVQLMCYKMDKTFIRKPAVDVELRIDAVKFYKTHAFRPSPFFDDDALVYDIIVNDKAVRTVFVDAHQMKEALLGKNATEKSIQDKAQPQMRNGVLEVDLHIDELLDNTAGMSNREMLAVQMKEFKRVMDEKIKQKGQKIVFIHGKGEGVLRKEILAELKRVYKTCTYQDASFREYGFGATMVIVK